MEKKNSFKEFLMSTTGSIVLTIVLIFIIYGIILLCLALEAAFLIIPIGLALFVFGWKTLGSTNPFLMIFASGNFMLFYYIFKVMLSFIIGYFVAPFKLSRMIVKKLKETV